MEVLKNYPSPESIAIVLTDQAAIFQNDRQRHKPKSPYWQDTCELKPILQLYFQSRFPGVPCEWILLDPTSDDQSLDNWNAVLNLVREKCRNLTIVGKEVKVTSRESVYVSHQASTPAVSSAIQFVSLALFSGRVKFLFSNEYNSALKFCRKL